MNLNKKVGALLAALLLSMGIAACEKEGPIEKAGEQADEAIEETKDAVNQGPLEKAGENVEEATEKAR